MHARPRTTDTKLIATPAGTQKWYLGERLSFLSMLRWKREGARHTAMFMGVIWFSSTEEVTSLRKQSSVCNTSRFSSDINMIAAWRACNRCSFGTSAHRREWMFYFCFSGRREKLCWQTWHELLIYDILTWHELDQIRLHNIRKRERQTSTWHRV